MKLPFGYHITKAPPLPTAQSLEDDLFAAVESVNLAWEKCREAKLKLSLWLEWQDKELVVTELTPSKKEPRK